MLLQQARVEQFLFGMPQDGAAAVHQKEIAPVAQVHTGTDIRNNVVAQVHQQDPQEIALAVGDGLGQGDHPGVLTLHQIFHPGGGDVDLIGLGHRRLEPSGVLIGGVGIGPIGWVIKEHPAVGGGQSNGKNLIPGGGRMAQNGRNGLLLGRIPQIGRYGAVADDEIGQVLEIVHIHIHLGVDLGDQLVGVIGGHALELAAVVLIGAGVDDQRHGHNQNGKGGDHGRGDAVAAVLHRPSSRYSLGVLPTVRLKATEK